LAVVEKDLATDKTVQDLVAGTTGDRLFTGGAIGGEISAANGWGLRIVAGIDSTAGSDDFYEIKMIDFDGDGDFGDSLVFANLPSTPDDWANYRLAFSVLFHDYGGGVMFNPAGTRTKFSGGTGTGDIVHNGNNVIGAPTAAMIANNWQFKDDGRFLINPIPEPASLAAWAGFAVVGTLVVGIRRRWMKN
jgi:hypothetical protein